MSVAVVTGAARGIGLETARALGADGTAPVHHGADGTAPVRHGADGTARRVYVTARDEQAGRAALEGLHLANGAFHQLDVADADSVRAFSDHLREAHGGFDILINNAGVLHADDPFPKYKICKNIIDINYFGICNTAKYMFPLLRENARVVNVSSDCGHLSNLKHPEWISRLKSESLQLADVEAFVQWYLESVRDGTFEPAHFQDGGCYAAYRVSKIAVSAATRVWARQYAARSVAVSSMHPGLVRTDMTRGAGFLSPPDAAAGLVALALRPSPDCSGAYVWHDGTLLDWADHEDTRWYFRADTLN